MEKLLTNTFRYCFYTCSCKYTYTLYNLCSYWKKNTITTKFVQHFSMQAAHMTVVTVVSRIVLGLYHACLNFICDTAWLSDYHIGQIKITARLITLGLKNAPTCISWCLHVKNERFLSRTC